MNILNIFGMKTVDQLLSDFEKLKTKLHELGSPLSNNEIWCIQQQIQVGCGQLILRFQEIALEKGIERDLWNVGFRTTITLLQGEAKNKKKGDTEAKDVLNWFLNSASGFYLQLLNQISSANSLDLIFRRKDSVYGLIGGGLSSTPDIRKKEIITKNALYLCQYCLIHLGDLARYRHQAKQAETFYRHAVTVAATSGHPYNQLALLEAGRGNKLASVFLYIRALCVPAPFPGAPSNLIQTLSKVLGSRVSSVNELNIGDEVKVEALVRMTKDEYISLFLHFHSCLLLKGNIETSKADIPRLSSALSMLAATTTLTRSSLVQMFAINIFTLHYFSGKSLIKINEDNLIKREEEKFVEPKVCEGAAELIEDLMVAMLAALLLPIHTMKEPEVVITYPALPAISLAFEWILFEDKILSQSLKKKQQIWPGLCSLVNFLQKPLINFNHAEVAETPLPEDRDLYGFQPLSKILSRYRFKDEDEKLTPDKCSLLRAKRLTDIAIKFSEKNADGETVIRKIVSDNQLLKFEAHSNQNPSVEEIVDFERLTLQPHSAPNLNIGKKKEKVGILKPQGSLERSKESKENLPKEKKDNRSNKQILNEAGLNIEGSRSKADRKSKVSPGDKRIPISRSGTSILIPGENFLNSTVTETVSSINVKPRTRTNVALQAILKRNSTNPETKQVTFQTPSPAISPNPSVASNESQRSQLSSPPPPASNKWGKPSTLLGVNNAPKFSSFGSLDYQPAPPHGTPFPNSPFSVQNSPRIDNPYNMFKAPHNEASGGMLPAPTNNSEFGPISQHMLRLPPPTHPNFHPSMQSSKQGIFQPNTKVNYSAESLPFQDADLQMTLYATKANANPWDKGSINIPKGDIMMGNLQSNTMPSQIDRAMQLPFKEINTSFSPYQGPPPYQQTSFHSQQRNFSFPNQELEIRNQLASASQVPCPSNIFQEPSFSNQLNSNPNGSSNIASLFNQRNMVPSSTNPIGNLTSGSISQSPNLSPGCSIIPNNMGIPNSLNLGSIGHLPVGQGSNNMNSQQSIGNNIGGSSSLNTRSNPASGNNLIVPGCNIGHRNSHNSNDYLQSSPNFPWWDKDPTNSSMYLSQLINQPPPNYQTTTPTTVDAAIPSSSNSGTSYSSVVPSSLSQGLSSNSSFGPERQFSQECNGSLSMRPSNTYSLFGPLGGSEPSGGHVVPSQHMLPSQQTNHQSLWSGPSPLQRLLEQKKFASNKQ